MGVQERNWAIQSSPTLKRRVPDNNLSCRKQCSSPLHFAFYSPRLGPSALSSIGLIQFAQKLSNSSIMSLMAKTGAGAGAGAAITVALAPIHHSLSSKDVFPDSIRFGFGYSRQSRFHVAVKRSNNLPIVPRIRAQSISEYLPDSKFYKVEAILRPWRIEKVSSALLKMGIRGVTVSDIRGFGAQGGVAERHAGSEFSEDKFVSKVKMEIVLSKDQVESVIDLITQEARTGELGDGKIFVLPVSDIIRVRTGERGEEAERMSGGRHEMFKSNGPA